MLERENPTINYKNRMGHTCTHKLRSLGERKGKNKIKRKEGRREGELIDGDLPCDIHKCRNSLNSPKANQEGIQFE